MQKNRICIIFIVDHNFHIGNNFSFFSREKDFFFFSSKIIRFEERYCLVTNCTKLFFNFTCEKNCLQMKYLSCDGQYVENLNNTQITIRIPWSQK